MGILETILEQNKAILSLLEGSNVQVEAKHEDVMLRSAEISKRIGVKDSTFHYWKDKLIPHGLKKFEGRWVMSENDLNKYLRGKELT